MQPPILNCGELGRCELRYIRRDINDVINENGHVIAAHVGREWKLLHPLDRSFNNFWSHEDLRLQWWKRTAPTTDTFIDCGALGTGAVIKIEWTWSLIPPRRCYVTLRFFESITLE